MKIKYKYSSIRKNIDVILKIDNKKVIFKNIADGKIESLSDILITEHYAVDYWDDVTINGVIYKINIFSSGLNEDNSILTISFYEGEIDGEFVSFPIKSSYVEFNI